MYKDAEQTCVSRRHTKSHILVVTTFSREYLTHEYKSYRYNTCYLVIGTVATCVLVSVRLNMQPIIRQYWLSAVE